MKLFHPTAQPAPFWRHFAHRDLAFAFCEASFPVDLRELADRSPSVYIATVADIPKDDPDAMIGYWRVFDSVCALCPSELRMQPYTYPGTKTTKVLEFPPIVLNCASDAALAVLQLYAMTQTGTYIAGRREKWEVFHNGYGCIGYYNAQAITYEPPAELDGRLRT